MIKSMTGYGRAHVDLSFGTVNLDLYSVNHRYQEISVRLPRELSHLEPLLHQKLRKYFRRGKVQLKIEIARSAEYRAGTINNEVLMHFYKNIEGLRRHTVECAPIALERLLSLPGVLEVPVMAEDGEIEETLENLLNEAVSSWDEMRIAEGANLKKEIDGHISEYKQYIAQIDSMWKEAKDRAFSQVCKRIRDTIEQSGGNFEDTRWFQEAAYMTDKWDVSEELARIASHILQFNKIICEKEASGKKIDFLIQELNRETNTIDSKVNDADIRGLAVEAKAALERVREQIQNLE